LGEIIVPWSDVKAPPQAKTNVMFHLQRVKNVRSIRHAKNGFIAYPNSTKKVNVVYSC